VKKQLKHFLKTQVSISKGTWLWQREHSHGELTGVPPPKEPSPALSSHEQQEAGRVPADPQESAGGWSWRTQRTPSCLYNWLLSYPHLPGAAWAPLCCCLTLGRRWCSQPGRVHGTSSLDLSNKTQKQSKKKKTKGEKERGSCCVGDGPLLRVPGTMQAVKLTAEMPPWGAGPGRQG